MTIDPSPADTTGRRRGWPGGGRSRRVALLTVGILTGAAIVGAPVGGHVGGTIAHVWSHLRPLADTRYVNEGETRWAVVNNNATLARGSGVLSVLNATPIDYGIYRVFFTRDVTTCAFTATIGLAGNSGTENPGFITVVGSVVDGPRGEPNENGVLVTTHSTSGAIQGRGFHLTVACQTLDSPAAAVGHTEVSTRRGPNTRR